MRAATLPDYRVADLDAVLGALRRDGVTVDERVEETPTGALVVSPTQKATASSSGSRRPGDNARAGLAVRPSSTEVASPPD